MDKVCLSQLHHNNYHDILLNPWSVCNFVARIRITKAAEFFKAVIPGMDPSMDKATAFHLTVHYMVFLRNALRQKDPAIIPKLHEVRIIACSWSLGIDCSRGG